MVDGRVCICLIYFAAIAVWLNLCFDSKGYQVKETLVAPGGGGGACLCLSRVVVLPLEAF